MINILHLRSFYAIAIEGNINQASRRINVSQSTLSKQLKALESRHKTALFTGRMPPLRLTSAGEDLFAQAKDLFERMDRIEHTLDQSKSLENLSIRIASDTPALAARLAQELTLHFVGLRLQVRIENARDTFELLRTGKADVALVTDPPVHGQFQYLPVFEDTLMAALPAQHPGAGLDHYDLSTVQNDTLLFRETSSKTRAAIEKMLLDQGVIPHTQFEMHTRETIRESIALGTGISFFFSLECPPDIRIVYKPILAKNPVPSIIVYMIFHYERRNQPMLIKCIDLLTRR